VTEEEKPRKQGELKSRKRGRIESGNSGRGDTKSVRLERKIELHLALQKG
jgi:hypothetical protein